MSIMGCPSIKMGGKVVTVYHQNEMNDLVLISLFAPVLLSTLAICLLSLPNL